MRKLLAPSSLFTRLHARLFSSVICQWHCTSYTDYFFAHAEDETKWQLIAYINGIQHYDEEK